MVLNCFHYITLSIRTSVLCLNCFHNGCDFDENRFLLLIIHVHYKLELLSWHVDFGENRFLFLIMHAINRVVKIKSPFYQGIESASSPGLYSLDVQYFRRTVFPRELGPGGGGPYSLREYGPPDRKLGRTVYPMTPVLVEAGQD